MDIVSINSVMLLFLVWYWMIDYWIDIPNLQTVDLPNSFEEVRTKSIDSIYMNMNEWIDVSHILANLVSVIYDYDYIESIESNITYINLPDRTCKDMDCTLIDFSRFTLLEELNIGNDCFSNVDNFILDGLNHLKSLKIGNNSFTKKKSNGWGYDEIHLFLILNCIELKSIEIGEYSFSDYADRFELINLPKLSTIRIGEIGRESRNFYYCSFEIKGMLDILC